MKVSTHAYFTSFLVESCVDFQLKSRLVTKSSKLKLYRTVIRPIVTCTAETWVLKENITQKLLVFGRKILRGIFGPKKENQIWRINPLTPKDHYSGRTATLTSKRCILYIYSTNTGTEYFKHGVHSPFFFLFKMQFVS